MSLVERTRDLARRARAAVAGRPAAPDPRDLAAWEAAVALWHEVFEPFSPLIEDGEVLELGCADGRMLGALVKQGGARRGIGIAEAAQWKGQADGAAWNSGAIAGLELHESLDRLEGLEPGTVDLVLCRDLDGLFPLDGLEERLARIHAVIRPGGEAILRVGCAGPDAGAGYGFMTPTAWTALVTRAGFEIVARRHVWADPARQPGAARRLPQASDDERLTADLRLHLVRPWESWELDRVREFGDQRRR